jgi:predicted outer membrane repeat protein
MAASNSGETIHICPGLYAANLDIQKSLTLIGASDGNGAGSTILQGSPSKLSVVNVASGNNVSLQHLRITGGNTTTGSGGGAANGGGVTNFGTLALTSCTIIGNTGGAGGGIFQHGVSLTLTDCTVAENHGSDGGGIFADGPLVLTRSTVSGNSATNSGGGILIKSTLTLDAASRVVGNLANSTNPNSGGGIANGGGAVTLSSADNVSGNSPDNCGGPTPVPLCNG